MKTVNHKCIWAIVLKNITLSSVVLNFGTVYECKDGLSKNGLSNRFGVGVKWVSGYGGIVGNCRADGLTRLNTTIQPSDVFATTGIPLGTCCYSFDIAITNLITDRWACGYEQNGA